MLRSFGLPRKWLAVTPRRESARRLPSFGRVVPQKNDRCNVLGWHTCVCGPLQLTMSSRVMGWIAASASVLFPGPGNASFQLRLLPWEPHTVHHAGCVTVGSDELVTCVRTERGGHRAVQRRCSLLICDPGSRVDTKLPCGYCIWAQTRDF